MTVEFGVARAVDAQAFGQPGQRTFRLRILGDAAGSGSLWLEKEQLQALSLALKQMISQLEYEGTPATPDAGDFPTVADHDFRVGRMGMGFHAEDRTVVLYAFEIGVADDEEQPTLRVRLTQEQCAGLGGQLDDVIAGGRPLCPLCGIAMDPVGHMCVRSNGHSKQPIPEDDHDEE